MLLDFIKRLPLKQIIRFGIVGVCSSLISYAIYFLLLRVGINANIAYTIGYAIGFIFNFFASSYFTFQVKATIKKGVGFIGSNLVNYIIQIILLNFFINIGIPEVYAPIPVYCISIPINILLVRFVFTSEQVNHCDTLNHKTF